MKNLLKIALLLLLIINIGCKPKPTPLPTSANVTLHFDNMAGASKVVLGAAPSYVSANGQTFSVDLLKYYISNIRLTNAAGVVKTVPGYYLIDEDVNGRLNIDLGNFANGNYTNITFAFGIDAEQNLNSSNVGDLDVSKGMYWEMVGYNFFKHEGNFINSTATSQGLLLHLGTNGAYVADVSLPISNNLTVAGVAKTINVKFDLAKVYSNGYDFNIDGNHQSTVPQDNMWIKAMRGNIATSFSFESVK
jgi:hypothetical protein